MIVVSSRGSGGCRRRPSAFHNLRSASASAISVRTPYLVNRQSDVYEREGIDLDVSTLADWVDAAAATLMPLVDVIRDHVFAGKLRYPSDVTDEEWELIVPLIPPGKSGGGKRTVIMREVVNGLMYVLSTGCQWRAIPKDLPPKTAQQSRWLAGSGDFRVGCVPGQGRDRLHARP